LLHGITRVSSFHKDETPWLNDRKVVFRGRASSLKERRRWNELLYKSWKRFI